MTSLAHRGFVHLGMDVSKDSISVAILHPDRDVAAVEKISSDSESVRRLLKKVGRPSGIWACYEAGPTGYDLYRLLASMKVRCDVVAPSLVPKGRGDRVKTDKRDSRRLAGLHRAGQLTPIAVPDPAQEAVRDLCRTRGDMVEDLTRARNRLTKFLLRHSMIYRDGTNWTIRHRSGCQGCTSRIGPWPPPSPTTAPPSSFATLPWRPSKPTCVPISPPTPSPRPWPAWAATGVSATWEPSAWGRRSSTGSAFPPPEASWASPG